MYMLCTRKVALYKLSLVSNHGSLVATCPIILCRRPPHYLISVLADWLGFNEPGKNKI